MSDGKCESRYTAWTGLTLHCTGDHLRGNILRGEGHQASYAGVAWTWYDSEADRTVYTNRDIWGGET